MHNFAAFNFGVKKMPVTLYLYICDPHREMLKIAKDDNQYRVELFQVNKLNILVSELVRQQLLELVETPGVSVVFNLDDVRFIDSAGFHVLVELADRAREAGSQFKLSNITDEVMELIKLTELGNRFDMISCANTGEKILMELD
ncbi:MAG: STAS domain-containing protein [Bacteroidales bacterium]|nr:STAS domain-containing protein [Bacteroidales bacterium]